MPSRVHVFSPPQGLERHNVLFVLSKSQRASKGCAWPLVRVRGCIGERGRGVPFKYFARGVQNYSGICPHRLPFKHLGL